MEHLALSWDFSGEKRKSVSLTLEKGEKKELFSANTTKLQEEISQNLLTVKGSRIFKIRNILFREKSIQIKFSGRWTYYQTFQVESKLKENIPEIEFV